MFPLLLTLCSTLASGADLDTKASANLLPDLNGGLLAGHKADAPLGDLALAEGGLSGQLFGCGLGYLDGLGFSLLAAEDASLRLGSMLTLQGGLSLNAECNLGLAPDKALAPLGLPLAKEGLPVALLHDNLGGLGLRV